MEDRSTKFPKATKPQKMQIMHIGEGGREGREGVRLCSKHMAYYNQSITYKFQKKATLGLTVMRNVPDLVRLAKP